MAGLVHLLPCNISDSDHGRVLPVHTLETMKGLSIFLVENLRSARRFLKRVDSEFDIDSCLFYGMGKNDPVDDLDMVIRHLKDGEDVGVLSESGCPGVADPGQRIVRLAHDKGIQVIPHVGPSSILLTLMGSGLNGQSFSFRGYVPRQGHDRRQFIQELFSRASRGDTQLFMEPPYRTMTLFEDLLKHGTPDARLCIAIDITGPKESIVTKTIAEWKRSRPKFEKIPVMMALGH